MKQGDRVPQQINFSIVRQAFRFFAIKIDRPCHPCLRHRFGTQEANTPCLDQTTDRVGARGDQVRRGGGQRRPVICDEQATLGHQLQGQARFTGTRRPEDQ